MFVSISCSLDRPISKRCTGLSTCVLGKLSQDIHRLQTYPRTDVGAGTPGKKWSLSAQKCILIRIMRSICIKLIWVYQVNMRSFFPFPLLKGKIFIFMLFMLCYFYIYFNQQRSMLVILKIIKSVWNRIGFCSIKNIAVLNFLTIQIIFLLHSV